MSMDTRLGTVYTGADAPLYYKGLHYGDYGTTKTVTSALIAIRKCLIIATDNGWTSLKNHPEALDKYDVVEYDGLSQLTEAAEWSKEPDFPYDLILVDTVSQVQEEYLDFLLEEITWSQNFREKSQVKNKATKLAGVEVPGRADYHVTRNQMRRPIKALIKAPVDVVFTAHLREPTEDEKNKGIIAKRPNMTQTVYQLMAREASVMALFERANGKITIKCETDKKQVAKSRIKSLDGATVDPTEFIKRIHDWKKN